MAAPTVVAASADAQWAVTGNITAGLPSGLGAGDLLILVVHVRNGAQTINLVSTYTLVSTDNASSVVAVTSEVQAKVAGSSESGPNVVSSQITTQPTGAILIAVRGASPNIANIVISAPAGAGSATLVAPTIDTVSSDNLVLRLYLSSDDAAIVTPPASHTQVFSGSTALGSDAAMHAYGITQASAGATGTASLVVAESDGYMAWTLAIPPATTVSGTTTGTVGGLSGAATGTVTPGPVTVPGTGAGSLGGLAGIAVGTRVVSGVASGQVGGLAGAAVGARSISGTGAGVAGGLVGTAVGVGVSRLTERPFSGTTVRPDSGTVTRP